MNEFFENLEQTMTGEGGQHVPPDIIFNYDKTNLSEIQGPKSVLSKECASIPNAS